MSVSRFGSSSKNQAFDNVDKNYVDQKFVALSTNLALKVNKIGDTLTGDLYLSFKDDNERSFGIKDITEGKSISLLLGDYAHQIRYNYGHPMKFAAVHGYRFTSSCGDVCKLGGSDSTNSHFYNDIIMNDKCISDLHNPKLPQDAATKNYVDARYVKNNVGCVPDLNTNSDNNSGFTVSASSERNGDSQAYNVFNSWKADWAVGDADTNVIQGHRIPIPWIQLQCPEKIRIHKFAVRSVRDSNDKILRWKLQASNDKNSWNDLYTGSEMATTTSFFNVDCLKEYIYYKIVIHQSKGKYPGLSYWQLYTLDPIV
jgi:hypothetical protein